MPARSTSPPARLGLALLGFYRRTISPSRPQRCRYYPTCSAYAEEAIGELGLVRGGLVAAWRLIRCNPFTPGGVDDLCERRLFATTIRSQTASEPNDRAGASRIPPDLDLDLDLDLDHHCDHDRRKVTA